MNSDEKVIKALCLAIKIWGFAIGIIGFSIGVAVGAAFF